MESIIQKNKECFVCKSVKGLECHHIFGAANRMHSEEYGLKVWLCHNHHNEPPYGVHFNRNNELMLKKIGQQEFEKIHGHDKFMQIFGRNWI